MATIDIVLGAVLGLILGLVLTWLTRVASTEGAGVQESAGLSNTQAAIITIVLIVVGGAMGSLV